MEEKVWNSQRWGVILAIRAFPKQINHGVALCTHCECVIPTGKLVYQSHRAFAVIIVHGRKLQGKIHQTELLGVCCSRNR